MNDDNPKYTQITARIRYEATPMKNDQIIPNAVGRLDDVVEAIRVGDNQRAYTLLSERYCQVRGKRNYYEKMHGAALIEAGEILRFMDRFAEDDGFRDRARKACGWKG